jgi:hypothetical protein
MLFLLQLESDSTPISLINTANEGPVRIQYKCLVYVFPEMKLRGLFIFKTEL